MKKLNYLLLSLAGLALASCSNEDLVNPGEGKYQIRVNLPNDLATRAYGDQISQGQTLNYTLFTSEGTFVESGTQTLTAGTVTTTVDLPLVKGHSYKIAFFSQATSTVGTADNPGVYSYDSETANVTVDYTKMASTANYEDAYDCFYANLSLGTVDGSLSQSITLTRPVAQINWGTDDLTSGAVDLAFGSNLQTELSMTAFDNLNALTGEVSGDASVDLTFDLPTTAETFPVKGYDYLAMQYVLAQTNGQSGTYDITLKVSNKDNSSVTPVTITVKNAPLQANYRTNIYGSLLTDQANINVELSSTWGAPSYNIVDGAIVKFTPEGTVECITPTLPDGVTEVSMQGQGAVAIGTDGKPVYFAPTGADIKKAMQSYSEIYLAPNTTIVQSEPHQMVVSQSVTIHGNGATISGGTRDFSIQNGFPEGSTIDLTISNLNNMQVWGGPSGDFTLNLTLINCTSTGSGNADSNIYLTMTRNDNPSGIINYNIESCYVQDTQVGMHSTYAGTFVINNCTFKNVGIPINYAKKEAEAANMTVNGCIFNACGILPSDTGNNAYDYAAPVRLVDNAGPANSINLLVENCTFNGTLSDWNILLWDYRKGTPEKPKISYPITYTIKNCTPSNPSVYAIDKMVNNTGQSN